MSGFGILEQLGKYQLYGYNSKFDESFADNAIIAQFTSLRLKYNLCLITSDYSYAKDGNLSQDIIDLRKSKSTENINDIKVFNILSNKKEFKEFINYNNKKSIHTKVKENTFKFSLPKNPHRNDPSLKTNFIPSVGNYIFDNLGNNHKLEKQIGRTGGEGSVYLTNTGYICKIFKIDKITQFRKNKIGLLIENNIKINNVCLPEFIVYNNNKQFVGYLMQQASGHELKTSIFIRDLFTKKFPYWNRIHLTKLAINIITTVQELHKYNIILGDINPNNILVENENKLYIIDTDSFQIEGYPCSVGMVAYTRKINHGKRYDEYLRNKEDDIFALSTLIFQLMLPGKHPYSYSGGGNEKDNMKPENFPYKCDKSGYNNAPDGQWVYIWSHLPYKLKEMFCCIFKKNISIKLSDMKNILEQYLYQLEQGHQTLEIFPKTFKQIDDNGNVVHDDFLILQCQCGREFALPNKKVEVYTLKNWKLPNKCDICRNLYKENTQKCKSCGKNFYESGKTNCKNCRFSILTCSDCNSTFSFSDSEREFFEKKGLSYPKKCYNCRLRNKRNKNY